MKHPMVKLCWMLGCAQTGHDSKNASANTVSATQNYGEGRGFIQLTGSWGLSTGAIASAQGCYASITMAALHRYKHTCGQSSGAHDSNRASEKLMALTILSFLSSSADFLTCELMKVLRSSLASPTSSYDQSSQVYCYTRGNLIVVLYFGAGTKCNRPNFQPQSTKSIYQNQIY